MSEVPISRNQQAVLRRGGHRRMMRSLTKVGPGPNVPQPSRWIPVADVPVWPILTVDAFAGVGGSHVPSILDAGPVRYVTAGRVAIAWALRLLGLGAEDKVLVPAYHCASMVEPLLHVGATPVFYRVRDDLSVDLDDIAAKKDPRTRALLVVNYFGFPQDLAAIRDFCDANDLFLVEDCAHSFFGRYDGRPLGSYGDYAIASLTKFFPVRDGGCLLSARRSLDDVSLRAQGLIASVQAAFALLEDSVYYDRLAPLKPVVRGVGATFSRVRRLLRPDDSPDAAAADSINPAQLKSGAYGGLDRSWMDVQATGLSRVICRRAATERLVRRRRENYRRLRDGLGGLKGARPILRRLPTEVVPYMFPLWVDDLPRVFPILEDLAVPMQRFGQFLWPGVDERVCAVSAAMSHHAIQLPCHQNLSREELDWTVSRVRQALSA